MCLCVYVGILVYCARVPVFTVVVFPFYSNLHIHRCGKNDTYLNGIFPPECCYFCVLIILADILYSKSSIENRYIYA